LVDLENELNENELFEDSVVLENDNEELFALITPNKKQIEKYLKENKIDEKDFLKSPKFKEIVEKQVDKLNKKLDEKQKIKNFKILETPLDENEKPMKGELKREKIKENHLKDLKEKKIKAPEFECSTKNILELSESKENKDKDSFIVLKENKPKKSFME